MAFPMRRWFRFSLRTILVVVTVVAVAVALFPSARTALRHRSYLTWRYAVHEGKITESELSERVGDEYPVYREFVDSLPPINAVNNDRLDRISTTLQIAGTYVGLALLVASVVAWIYLLASGRLGG